MNQEFREFSRGVIRAARRSPRVANSLSTLAIQLYKNQEYELALEATNILIRNAQTPLGYVIRAATNLAIGNAKSALFDANQALNLDDRLSLAYLMRSEAHRTLGNVKDAELDRTRFDESYQLHGDKIDQEFFSAISRFMSALRGDLNAMYNLEAQDTKVSLREMSLFGAIPIEPPSDLVGRANELRSILESLRSQSFVVVTGLGGIGKTVLAATVAQNWLQNQGELIWIKFEPNSSLESLCDAIARAVNNSEIMYDQDPSSKIVLTRNLLTTYSRLLIVLDDVWLPVVVHDFCKQVIPNSVRILVTSRMNIPGLGNPFILDNLTPAASMALLKEITSKQSVEDEEILLTIVQDVNHHPLAISIAGALVSSDKFSANTLLEKLISLKRSEQPGSELWNVLGIAYEGLESSARNLLLLLVFCPEKSAGSELLSLASSLVEDAVTIGLHSLVASGLAHRIGKKRFAIHDTVWSYVRAIAMEAEEDRTLHETLKSAIANYTGRHRTAHQDDLDALELELGNILGTAAQAANEQDHQTVLTLAFNLVDGEFLYTRGYYRQAVELLTSAVESARAVGNTPWEVANLNNLALVRQNLGQITVAVELYEAVIKLNQFENDLRSEAASLGNLGSAYADLGKLDEALSKYEQALQISVRLNDHKTQVRLLGNLGAAFYKLGDFDKALKSYDSALSISLKIDDRQTTGRVQSNMGLTFASLGDSTKATEYYAQALSISQLIGDRRSESNILGNLGLAYQSTGNLTKGIEYLTRALEISRDLGDRRGESNNLVNLGNIYGDQGKFSESVNYYTQGLQVCREIGDQRMEATALSNLANTLFNLKSGSRADNLEQAVVYLTESLNIYTVDSLPKQWAMAQASLGVIHSQRILGNRADNLEQAIFHYQQALLVYTRADFPVQWATTQNNLATAYVDRTTGNRADNLEQAIFHYQQALELRTRESFPIDWATTQNNLGTAYSERLAGERAENLEQAILHYQLALLVYTRADFPVQWATTQNNLANAYVDRITGNRADNLEQAIFHYQLALELRTRESFPIDWATTQNNLGTAYSERQAGERAENLEQAIFHYEQALRVYSRTDLPHQWAMAHYNLANAYTERIYGDEFANIEKAKSHADQSLELLSSLDKVRAESARQLLEKIDASKYGPTQKIRVSGAIFQGDIVKGDQIIVGNVSGSGNVISSGRDVGGQMWADLKSRIEELSVEDREDVDAILDNVQKLVDEINAGTEKETSLERLQRFLEQLYGLAPDIGQAVVQYLLNPNFNMSIVIQEIASKVRRTE